MVAGILGGSWLYGDSQTSHFFQKLPDRTLWGLYLWRQFSRQVFSKWRIT
uniref:Uncharacterized protein n=1 Tax=Lepeophtheirus salmonis TaxID=72036 RepID=A0A0K2TEM8_LEPSM